MTQTYLVPAKTAELIGNEQFKKTIKLETLKFIDNIKKSSDYKSALKTNIVKQQEEADKLFAESKKVIDSLKNIVKLLPKGIPTTTLREIFKEFNIYVYDNTIIGYDLDAHLERRKSKLDSGIECMATQKTILEFNVTLSTIYAIENDLLARVQNRIRMSKIESYDKIVKQISSKMNYQTEIKEIHDFIVEIDKLNA